MRYLPFLVMIVGLMLLILNSRGPEGRSSGLVSTVATYCFRYGLLVVLAQLALGKLS